MCLLHPIFKRYNRDIKAYKVLKYSSLCSPYRNKCYNFNTSYAVSVVEILDHILFTGSSYLRVNTGIHSYTSLRQAYRDNAIKYGGKVFLAKIPQGAYTIKGINNEIVSTSIICMPYYYVPVRIFGRILFFIKKKYHEDRHRETE